MSPACWSGDVQAAELLYHLGNHRLDLRLLCDVAGNKRAADAHRANLIGRLLASLFMHREVMEAYAKQHNVPVRGLAEARLEE